MTNKSIVLVCGLNIRAHNRITLDEQRRALETVAGELEARPGGDQGASLRTSRHDGERVVNLVLGALTTHRQDLTIPGAAVISPPVMADALAALTMVLRSKYGCDFDGKDYGIRLNGDLWRAGLALPLSPKPLPAPHAVFHTTKNAMIFGWTPGGMLVAKREAKNIHWGRTVTDPAWRLLRRQAKVEVEFTSRSANVLREFVG